MVHTDQRMVYELTSTFEEEFGNARKYGLFKIIKMIQPIKNGIHCFTTNNFMIYITNAEHICPVYSLCKKNKNK